MPVKLDVGDRRTLLVAAGVFLLLVIVTLLVAPTQGVKSELPTTYSSASGGAKAAYLLLKESGFRVDRWERAPSDLRDPAGTTLVLAEPAGVPGGRDAAALREFVAGGGRVIATGIFAASFLPEAAIIPRPWMITWQRVSALSPARPTRVAPSITLVPQAYWTEDTRATPLYGDGEHIVAVQYAYGKGEVLWWASATPLTNAALREPGNLEFFLTCVGAKAERRILWDEFFHGFRRSARRSIAQSPLAWLAAQTAVLIVALLLTFSRRSGPVLAPPGEVRLSPLEFVQTLGGLYQRAGAASVAVDVCHQRFRYWLTRRLGMAANTPAEELARAVGERWRFTDDQLAPTLRACEGARDKVHLSPKEALRLVRALYRYAAALRVFRPS